MNRRTVLKLAACTALPQALLRAGSALAAADDVIELGCLVPMSGPFAASGKFADMGTRLAVEQYAKVLGKPVRYRMLDTEGKPSTAVRKVQEAAQKSGVRFVTCGVLSSEVLAMGKEAERLGGVLVTSAGADELMGKDCNRATFRWAVPTIGAIERTVRPLIESMPKARRWYTITPQYVFGDGLLSAAKAAFAEKGIEHVGNSYHSLVQLAPRPHRDHKTGGTHDRAPTSPAHRCRSTCSRHGSQADRRALAAGQRMALVLG